MSALNNLAFAASVADEAAGNNDDNHHEGRDDDLGVLPNSVVDMKE